MFYLYVVKFIHFVQCSAFCAFRFGKFFLSHGWVKSQCPCLSTHPPHSSFSEDQFYWGLVIKMPQQCRLQTFSEFCFKRFAYLLFNLFLNSLHFIAALWTRCVVFAALGSLSLFQAAHPPSVHTAFPLVGTVQLMSRPLESMPDHLCWHSGDSQTLLTLSLAYSHHLSKYTLHWFSSPRRACFLYWGKEGDSL